MAVLVEARQSHCSAEILQHPHSLCLASAGIMAHTGHRLVGMAGEWQGPKCLQRRQQPALQREMLAVRSSQARSGNALPKKVETSCLPRTLNAELLDPWAKKFSSDIWLLSRVQEIRISIHSLWGIQGVTQFSYQVFLLLKTAQNHSCLGLSCLFFWTKFSQKAIELTPQGNLYPSA